MLRSCTFPPHGLKLVQMMLKLSAFESVAIAAIPEAPLLLSSQLLILCSASHKANGSTEYKWSEK